MRYNVSAFLQCNSINSQGKLISFYKEGCRGDSLGTWDRQRLETLSPGA